MKTRPAERVFAGHVASPGLARGPIALHLARDGAAAAKGTPAQERRALEGALDRARERLGELAGQSDRMGGDILMFQIALLEDPELTAPAFDAVEAGAAAVDAWRAALDAQIVGYLDADDAYFQARAADLKDLRDRVAGLLRGGECGPAAGQGIYVADDLAPSRFLETDWTRYRGAALVHGGAAGHVAMLARARGIPLVIGLGADLGALRDGAEAILDAEAGRLIQNPAAPTLERYRGRLAQRRAQAAQEAEYLAKPALTADGARVQVCINVDDPAALAGLDPAHCDGIGLTRTEFLFYGGAGLPDEETQLRAYVRLLDWAGGRPVTVRTLDAGGDKPIPGLTPDGEANPFLGLRGLRLSLARPEVFRVQLRALARAAVCGPLKVMVPMVTVPAELDRARALFREAVAELEAEGVEARLAPLGMMVEVPAAALTIADFDADFYSIGSNDLVQYVTATSRDGAGVANLHDSLNPAVLELIGRVARHGAAAGREVSLCGDMAAEPACLARLLAAGLRAVSVAPAALARTKAAVARSRCAGDGADDR